MATNWSRKIGVFRRPIFIVALPFRNGLEYPNGDGQFRSAFNVATTCTTLVRFGAVTPEKLLLIFILVWKNPKIGISSNYLRKCWINLTELLALIDMWPCVRMFKLTFVFRSLRERCYGKQLIWGWAFSNDEIDCFQFGWLEFSELEFAGLENDGPHCRTGIWRTGKWRTKLQDWKMTDHTAGLECDWLQYYKRTQ